MHLEAHFIVFVRDTKLVNKSSFWELIKILETRSKLFMLKKLQKMWWNHLFMANSIQATIELKFCDALSLSAHLRRLMKQQAYLIALRGAFMGDP